MQAEILSLGRLPHPESLEFAPLRSWIVKEQDVLYHLALVYTVLCLTYLKNALQA